ncbi:MAG: choice-of-anchor V domain-containing protein [Acidobacteriota bacterium]|nr:hypothetical protein [Blastocatellia bacterium]MDW8240023.1 choice-of-anchor V domain-containing protein [Acidobacteriota bacterium]
MKQTGRINHLSKLIACICFFGVVGLTYAYSTGPLPGFTDAPGEGNCTECHDSFGEQTNTGPGSLSLTHPSRYEVGQRIPIIVELTQAGARRWGFQLTALTTGNNPQPAGQFVITDPEHTQLLQGDNGRWYVQHTAAGSFAGRTSARWMLEWIAPETDVGTVAFYVSGNAANNDGSRLGDRIYTTLSSISPPSYPAATVLEPANHQVVTPGQTLTLRWDATANAQSFDILFFPFAGGLPETIVFGLPADTRSYEWTVPPLVSDAARIAVLAFNDVGFGLSETSVLIVNRSPQVQVTEPNTPRTVRAGDTLRITWNVASELRVTRQQVRLSLDGGKTYPQVLTTARFSTTARSFNWTVPATVQTHMARVLVLVQTDNNLLADENDADIVINNPTAMSAFELLPDFQPKFYWTRLSPAH